MQAPTKLDAECSARIDSVSGATLSVTVDVGFEDDAMQSRSRTHVAMHGTITINPTTHAIVRASFTGQERFELRSGAKLRSAGEEARFPNVGALVLDFGIARLREAESGVGATKTGALMGTPAFLPPEQAGGRTREVDGQTDVWAVGATLFNLLSDEYVHVAENPAQMVVFAATQPARSISTLVPNLSAAIVELVDRALAFDRSAR